MVSVSMFFMGPKDPKIQSCDLGLGRTKNEGTSTLQGPREVLLLLWICVIGFEKRAHFAQNYNFHYGLKLINSRACT